MKTAWELSHIYKDNARAREELAAVAAAAADFCARYAGKLGQKLDSAAAIDVAVGELEGIYERCGRVGAYAYLGFAKDSEAGGAFMQEVQNELAKIEANLVFFEVEFCELAAASGAASFCEKSGFSLGAGVCAAASGAASFCEKSGFSLGAGVSDASAAASEQSPLEQAIAQSKYAYLLRCWLDSARYNLSAECEQLNARLSPLGAAAFSRFFDEYLSFIDFRFDGEKITEEALLAKLYDPDRAVRKKAADAMSAALSAHQKPLVFIFNQIKNAHAINGDIRGYENPMRARNISNQISDASVAALIAAAESSFSLVHDYYRKKGEILGISELQDYDRYAPIDAALGAAEQSYSFSECVSIVRRCFAAFSPRFVEFFDAALADGRVDVFPAAGKRSGAFAYGVAPAPYVMLNHTDGRRDLFTLAHEMGHLIHQSLSIEANGYFYHHTPLTTAETASVFAEMLVFDELRKTLAPAQKKALLASKIEDIFATFYRQINFTTFEQRLHAAPGELAAEQIAQIWLEESRKMFGSALTLRAEYRHWFSYVPHFIHSPFYCYSYSFAQLLVLALFGLYKSGACSDFIPRYEAFLSAGGSASPAALVASFGLDLESAEFWQLGVAQIAALVKEFCE